MLRTKFFPQFRYSYDLCDLMAQQAQYPFIVRYPQNPQSTLLDVICDRTDFENTLVNLNDDNLKTPLSRSVLRRISRRKVREVCSKPLLRPPEDRTRIKLWIRIQNSFAFSEDDLELIDKVFGFEQYAPQKPENFAYMLKISATLVDETRGRIAKLVKKLRSYNIWPEAQIPDAWRIQTSVLSEQKKVEEVFVRCAPEILRDVYLEYYGEDVLFGAFIEQMSSDARWKRGYEAYLYYRLTTMSGPEIARWVGFKSATSVYWWNKEIHRYRHNAEFAKQVDDIKRLMRSRLEKAKLAA